MSQYDQQHQVPAYPPPPTSYAAADTHKGPYVMAPPPWVILPRTATSKGTPPWRPELKETAFLKDVWLDCVAAGAWIAVSDDNMKTKVDT